MKKWGLMNIKTRKLVEIENNKHKNILMRDSKEEIEQYINEYKINSCFVIVLFDISMSFFFIK